MRAWDRPAAKMSDHWGELVARLLFPAWEGAVRRRRTLPLLHDLEASQWRSPERLEALRMKSLSRLLRHAYFDLSFYRARFDAVGARPDDIHTLADLARLPLLTRDQAIDSHEARRSPVAPLPTISKATGGTTGEPLRFAYDARSEDWRQAVKLRGWGWAGYRVGARTLYYWGAPLPRPFASRMKTGLDRALKRETYVDCTRRGEADLDAVAAMIAAAAPQVIICFTQAGADLARHINERGLRRWDTIPILCCAEGLFPDDRAAMSAAFGPAVFETYGCREMMLIASECAAHDGMHVSEENLIVELIVREPGGDRPARPGELGEVVLTDLHNFGMPFIRYANGDLATRAPAGSCACGRGLERLVSVDGRVTETLRDGRGGHVSGLVFHAMFMGAFAAGVRQFQALQHVDGAITLKIVPRHSFVEATRAEIERRCAEQIPGVAVRIDLVTEIPLAPNGKRRVVVIERPPVPAT
jgi:phenylacetate-coenzyme A ligase PaaK-like adenylate-forming protein